MALLCRWVVKQPQTNQPNNDELDDVIDKYSKYIAVFYLLFDMAECGWLYKLAHKYGKKNSKY